MRCIAIDPGASTGWALYETSTTAGFRGAMFLVACGACAPENVMLQAHTLVDRIFYEKPQKYPHDDIDPNTLITLGVSAGTAIGPFVAAGATAAFATPKEWKGQTPKAISHARSWAALTPDEQAVVGRCGKGVKAKPLLDMLDAVALGQWAIARGLWR